MSGWENAPEETPSPRPLPRLAPEGRRMSGWENIPEETPSPRPLPGSVVASDVAEAIPSLDSDLITDGEFLRAAEWYFPALWIGMLAVVALIGIYEAVGKLPNSPW